MKPSAWLVAAICALPAPALAKDMCITMTATGDPVLVVLSKAKLPKLGRTEPWVGSMLDRSLVGAITRVSAGQLEAGFTVFAPGGGCVASATLDDTLTGVGDFVCGVTTTAVVWAPVSCP